MHFVKKQPTTEEEKAVKAKERAVKLKAFITLRDRIFENREADKKDEEQLQQIATVLAKNPDIYTFWNIRREVLIYLEAKINKECPEQSVDKISRLLDDELGLTRLCLESNPKSYSAWHHRGWALARHPKPNFEADLKLCEKALQMDCRNFHCWDHRRYVASLVKLSMDEELEFSNRMISQNFSNFSAWHYRGTLFLRKAAMLGKANELGVELVKNELKKVTNAFYTDPADQSAWIYGQFLAAHIEPSSQRNTEEILSMSFKNGVATIVFNRAQTLEAMKSRVFADENATWEPISTINSRCTSAKIWRIKTSSFRLNKPITETNLIPNSFVNRASVEDYFYMREPTEIDTLNESIEHIQELLKEEKESVWGLLTLTFYLLRTKPVKCRDLILKNLDALCHLDQNRKNAYLAIMNRILISAKLEEIDEGKSRFDNLIETGSFSIRDAKIISIECLWPLAGVLTDLDVSSNKLKTLESFSLFPLLTHITATGNPILSISNRLNLPSIEFLSVAQTPLYDLESVKRFLGKIVKTKKKLRLLFAETPLSDQSKELFEVVKDEENIRLIPYWL
ncbi:unnamed protein product, partial [Mesorhabditis belari]|uniref:Geranylgeranyl transferase type-2 subunit alpha n=1 Tax=Mesorhabditis belari TaxID=2138241 RepID=A0AAF3F2L7_9BILA